MKTIKAGELIKLKLGFNQIDPMMNKQQSIDVRLRKPFQIKK